MTEEISFTGDEAAESTGGGGGFDAAPRGVYWLQIMEVKVTKTSPQAKNPGVTMLQFQLEVADEDERGALGRKVWHNVTLIPRGKGEKAAAGHGIAVHWFKATQMPFDGRKFDVSDFLDKPHNLVQAFLEEDTYTKNGYTNPSNKINVIYTDEHPAPKDESEWPPLPKKKEKAAAAGAAAGQQVDLEEVPF